MHISQVIVRGGNPQVLAHAETLLTRLSLELNLVPSPVAPAAPAAPSAPSAPPTAVPVRQPTASGSGSSAQAGPSGQPVASGSGSLGLPRQADASAPGPSNISSA
ncbi:hypothetical protein FRC08_001787 [Ceratobasidium sp. 394]|nr:hypothetical protein FRC08_001787 [Ceratobasidium sp. 394]